MVNFYQTGSVHQPGEDDCSIYRLQCCVALSVRTEQSQRAEQNVAAAVLNLVKQLVIRVFDQLGSRQLVCTAVTGLHTAV